MILQAAESGGPHQEAPAVLRVQLEPLANDNLMVTCTAFRVPLVDSPMAAAKKALRFLARRVLCIEREIVELLDDLDCSRLFFEQFLPLFL